MRARERDGNGKMHPGSVRPAAAAGEISVTRIQVCIQDAGLACSATGRRSDRFEHEPSAELDLSSVHERQLSQNHEVSRSSNTHLNSLSCLCSHSVFS